MKLSIKKGGNLRNILLFAVLTISIIAILNLYQKQVRNFFYLISAPIQKTFWRAGNKASDFFETISEIKNLKKENKDLKSKIQSLLAENVSLKELEKENEALRVALNLGLEKEFKLTLTQVIGKDISQDSLIIDKGSKDGVSKNQPVITEKKTLVGKIGEVYKNFSKVQLSSNKESSFDGKISDTEISGVVKGMGNFKILFILVSQDKEIKKGDLLVTTAVGGIFPEGLLAGEIKEVKKSDIEPFQQIEISPFYDIKELERLFLISEVEEHSFFSTFRYARVFEEH